MPQPGQTHVRRRILLWLMAYAGLCHFNRISMSVAGTEHIMQDYAISETQMGFVYSSYLFVYTLCMIPGGWLIDAWGPKRALLLMGLASAIFLPLTGLTSFAPAGGILIALCIVRGMLGVASTPMHPGAARTVSFWIPYQTRSLANGMVTGAAVFGIASTYYVFGYLMDHVGWPNAFLIAGGVTLLLSLVWAADATDRPREHRGVNADERQAIEGTEPGSPAPHARHRQDPTDVSPNDAAETHTPTTGHNPAPRHRSLIALTLSYAALSYFQYLFFYWVQYYFDHVLALGKEDGRFYATIPTLAMAVGMILGGWLADRIELRVGGRLGRTMTPVAGMVASAVLLVIGILGGPPMWVVACFALAMGALGASESSFWVTGVDLGCTRGGMSAAILNTGGNAGGVLSPLVTPMLATMFGWKAGLGLASGICLLGAALWWWVDPPRAKTDP